LQTAVKNTLDETLDNFIAAKDLPSSYRELIRQWYLPMLTVIAERQTDKGAPLLVGINGCQGSGKSTLAELSVELLGELFQKKALTISIDDFYLTLDQRKQLASDTHPLLLTRGVPGTHDIGLANDIVSQLLNQHTPVAIPVFDKTLDDRLERAEWPVVNEPLDIIVIEGWCLGAKAQEAAEITRPVNELEEFEDRSLSWRRYVNDHLATSYREFFQRFDYWAMLKAPSFSSVYRWRLEQEEKLKRELAQKDALRHDARFMSPQQIRRFIQYYQRITENVLQTLPTTADCVFELDDNRQVVATFTNH
jgi:D-glycerate 3-kinase